MVLMFCRNRVADFAKWKAVFDEHLQGQEEAGLRLRNLWRSIDEPNNVFFIFEVTDIDKARAFISTPKAAEAGQVSGVLDGECHFLEAGPGD
jgi:hypothetical protein